MKKSCNVTWNARVYEDEDGWFFGVEGVIKFYRRGRSDFL